MEEVAKFGRNEGLLGVITQPALGPNKRLPAVILLNAGLIHRIGPNRLYVKMARALKELGLTSLRFDISGIGDSKNSTQDLDFTSNAVQNLKEAMNYLTSSKGINRFIVLGICSGADIAFRACIEDERIIATIPINGYYLDLPASDPIFKTAFKACSMRYYKKNALNANRWVKLFSGKSKAFSKKNISVFFNLVSKTITKRISLQQKQGSKKTEDFTEQFPINDWEKLIDRKVCMLNVFSEGSDAYDVYNLTIANKLKGFVQKGLLDFKLLNDVDHIFTPEWSQEHLISILTNWISSKWEQGFLTISENPDNLENKKIEDLLILNI